MNEQNSDLSRSMKALSELEEQLARKYTDIGKGLMAFAEIEGKEVDGLVDDIISQRRTLSKLRNEAESETCIHVPQADQMVCTHCGAIIHTDITKKEIGHETTGNQ